MYRYPEIDVARYILYASDFLFQAKLSMRKLQLLLFFCQKEYIQKYNYPLFETNFYIGQFGPYLDSVRSNWSSCIGNIELPIPEDNQFDLRFHQKLPILQTLKSLCLLTEKELLSKFFENDMYANFAEKAKQTKNRIQIPNEILGID